MKKTIYSLTIDKVYTLIFNTVYEISMIYQVFSNAVVFI